MGKHQGGGPYKNNSYSVCLGHSVEEQLPSPCSLKEFGETQIKFTVPEIELGAAAIHCPDQRLTANNCNPVGELAHGTPRAGANKASDQNLSVEQRGEQITYVQISLECAANLLTQVPA